MTTATPNQLPAIERALLRFYQTIDRCSFNRRQRAVLRTIRRRSFDRGLPQCWIPELSYFVEDNQSEDCRLTQADASRAVDELEKMFIIMAPKRGPEQVRKGKRIAGQRQPGWYGINVLFSSWYAVEKQVSPVCDNMWLKLEEPLLPEVLRECFIEFGGDSSPNTPLGTRAVESLRPGQVDPGCVRDTAGRPPGDMAACPLAEKIAGRPEEHETPSGALPSNTGEVLLKKQHPENNTPHFGAVQSVVKKTTGAARPAIDGPDPAVVKKTTPPEKGASVVAPPVSPPTPPPSKAFNVERSPLNAQKRKPGKPVTRAEEAYALDLLAEWLGEKEMETYGPMWRVRWARNCPDLIAEEIGWGRMLEKTQDINKPRNRVKWLMWRLKKHFRIREVTDMPIGPEPI